MEKAIANGFERVIPNIKILYCARYLKQRDKMKLDSLLEKATASAAEKIQTKAEILKDIDGERMGTTYGFGLAEAANDEDFLGKLNSLDRRWESLCLGFFQWFCDNRVDKFLESVICSAREGTEVAGLYHQNDIESMHFVEKKKRQFRKENVIDVITNVSTLIQQSQREEIRALYRAGRYELATTHKRFAVDSARWHSWSEKRCASHVDAFRNFRPGLADAFEKAKTARRKTSFRIKQKALAPELIEDRWDCSSKRQALDDNLNAPSQARESAHSGEPSSSAQPCSQNSIRFADPREKA